MTSYSGQITLTSIGTQGPDVNGGTFLLKQIPTNSGTIYIGNSSNTVTSSTGFPLVAGEVLLLQLSNLMTLYFMSTVSGEKLSWLRCDV